MAENIPKWLDATKNLGAKVTRAVLPSTLAAGATAVVNPDKAEVGSAATNTALSQIALNAGSAGNRWIKRRTANKTLSNAQSNLDLQQGRLKNEQDAHAESLKALDEHGIKYDPAYAAALNDGSRFSPRDSARNAVYEAQTSLNASKVEARQAEIAKAQSQVEAGQKGVDSTLAAQEASRGEVANRNAALAGVAGVASVPALNAAQKTFTKEPSDPNAPKPDSWGGATGRTVGDAAALAAHNVLGKPTPDEGLPWDKIAIGGGAAALLAALLYKITGSNQSRDDDEDEG